MRAVVSPDFAATPTVTDVPRREPGPGEVLVRVKAASLNGFDVAVASGRLQGMMEHQFPVVLGKDFAGTVEQVGEGVDRFAVGDPVFGVVMKPLLGEGSFGEFVTVGDQFGIAALPDGLDLAAAGSLGLAGSAAHDAVAAIAPKPGDSVLVVGATGGVGALVTQCAAATGATVIATAWPGDDADFVREYGATHVVDPDGDLEAAVRAVAPEGVSAVVHLAGDPTDLVSLLAPGGRLASTLGFGPAQNPAATAVIATPTPATLEQLAEDVVAGRIRVPITRTYELADVAEALDAFAAGTRGKFAVTVA